MNTDKKNEVIISENDYQLLRKYCPFPTGSDEEMSLGYELNRAIVVKNDSFPKNCIRVGSKVLIQDIKTQKIKEFIIDIPHKANISLNIISVLTPMAAAIIGFRKGEEVSWKMPGGVTTLRILDVHN